MLTRSQLRELHGSRLPLHILEQDYIQALYLRELYEITEELVFKGGTFLKHAHGLDRFSEDLDFTRLGDHGPSSSLREAASSLSHYGVEAAIHNPEEQEKSVTGRLRYRGPLYDGTEKSVRSIHIEVSTRRDVFLEPRWTRLFFEYPETRVINSLSLQKTEALAEKLRALSTREKGRDLYDVWFMLKQGTEAKPSLFMEKMKVMDKQPIVEIRVTEREWRDDLEVLLINPPDYRLVLREVTDELRDYGLEVTVAQPRSRNTETTS